MPKAGNVLEIVDMALDTAQLLNIVPKLYNKFVAGVDPDAKRQQLEGLITSGKIQEAGEEVINSWTTGLSGIDEMRLLRDVCHLIAGEDILIEEGQAFFSFLSNSDEKIRTKFREAYITERDHKYRWDVIFVMAKLSNDELRMQFIIGSGMLDPTLMEQVMDITKKIGDPIGSLAEMARKSLPDMKQRHDKRVAARKAKAAKAKKSTGSFWEAISDMLRFKLS